MNNSDDKAYWLLLQRAPLIGYKTFHDIVSFFPHLKDFFDQQASFYRELGFNSKTVDYLLTPDWHSVEAELNWEGEAENRQVITLNCQEYPLLLKQLEYPPPVLFIKGNASLLNQTQIAIVGTRHPSPQGKENAHQFASALTEHGLIVTSGLALGIDQAAHNGALYTGSTIAIIGTGINLCYPKAHTGLADKICEQGAIVSEFPLHTPPVAMNFPRRNRLISGLSIGTLVIEANLKSGSLITARFALEQGRELFAIPSSIHNLRARGCHLLLKQGAKLVENVSDILEELQFYRFESSQNVSKSQRFSDKGLDDNHIKLLECIGYEPTKIDILVERSNYPIQKVTSILTDLELSQHICSTIDGFMRVS